MFNVEEEEEEEKEEGEAEEDGCLLRVNKE